MQENTINLASLSGIKGATSSAAVEEIFESIKKAHGNINSHSQLNDKIKSAVGLNELRDDVVNECTEQEKNFIIQNFPQSKNRYLIVQKVIEE